MNIAGIYHQLTQLWKIALPLMLSSLSGVLMLFIDRLMLAQYTLDAHNAAVEATNIGWAFLVGLSTLASISQVFVSQYTGAKRHCEIGKPVWQMMWFSVICGVVLVIFSSHCAHWIFGSASSCQTQRTYLSYMLYFTPMHGLFAALCGFYVGRSRPFYPTCVVLCGNMINAVACYVFVFGYGSIPSLGAQGAAIAMNLAVSIQVVILLIGFLSKANRENFGTNKWKLDIPILKSNLAIGLPSACFTLLEVTGWALFYKMMAGISHKHLTVAGIVQNILILSFFFNEGMSKAITARVGNLIGAKKVSDIQDVIAAGFFSITLFILFLAGFLSIFYQMLIDLFLQSVTAQEGADLYSALVFGCVNAVIYKYLEGIRMVIAGALTAAADTYFLLLAGTACVWIGMVFPIYFFVYRTHGSIEKALVLCSTYTLFAAIVYLCRFYSNVWKKRATVIS